MIATAIIVLLAIVTSLGIMFLNRPPAFTDDATVTVRVDEARLRAEIAVSSEKLAKGLMGAEPLADDRGLLFVYEQPATHRIWMKGVSFPIDIVWISGDTVTQVTSKVPPAKPGAADADIPKYSPDGPVDKVLEVSAGWARRHSVQPGDPVRFSR